MQQVCPIHTAHHSPYQTSILHHWSCDLNLKCQIFFTTSLFFSPSPIKIVAGERLYGNENRLNSENWEITEITCWRWYSGYFRVCVGVIGTGRWSSSCSVSPISSASCQISDCGDNSLLQGLKNPGFHLTSPRRNACLRVSGRSGGHPCKNEGSARKRRETESRQRIWCF